MWSIGGSRPDGPQVERFSSRGTRPDRAQLGRFHPGVQWMKVPTSRNIYVTQPCPNQRAHPHIRVNPHCTKDGP